jgi:hypothetical protein
MKEFITAVEEVVYDDEREKKIKALIEEGKTRDEAVGDTEPYIAFKIDGRELRSFMPNDGQLAFMLAALGRGQTQENRFAAIINIMLSSLRDEDADYFEGRLLEKDPKKRIPVQQVEAVFEYLAGEWFGGGEDSDRPTQPSSGSASSQPSDGQNSTPPTTNSPEDSSDSDPTDS